MMRKYVSRLLALALVLCMVVLCVPVRAYADTPIRPEGMTDEEWAEYLRKWNAVVVTEETVAADTTTTVEVVTTDASGAETTTTPAPAPAVPEQSVTVIVPVEEGATVEYSLIMPGAVIKKGATVRYAIVAENSVIEENAVVGESPESAADIADWGITVVGENLTVGRGATVSAKQMLTEKVPAGGRV